MKRMIMTGLSVLLLSTVLAPSAIAGNRTEPRLIKDTNPEFRSIQAERQQATQATNQRVDRGNQASMNNTDRQANTTERMRGRGGSERFRTAHQAELNK